jgi:SNF2 family DNA or RNA helicase
MRLQTPCPLCQKPLELVSEYSVGPETMKVFKCGHAFSSKTVETLEATGLNEVTTYHSLDSTKRARPYQESGVNFILGRGEFQSFGEKRGYSCIIADQMRLGKTPQSLLAVRNLLEEAESLGEDFSVLCLVRAANIWQWTREARTWVDNKPNAVWVIEGTKSWIPPGFKLYIISMDTFSRKGMADQLLTFGFKMVIADEAHSFKNPSSNRSQSLTAFLKTIESSTLEQELTFNCPFCKHTWDEVVKIDVNTMTGSEYKSVSKRSLCGQCGASVGQAAGLKIEVKRQCAIVLLTGTPIKNRAEEYFVPLNLVAPDRFPSLEGFRRKWLIQDAKGRWSRISPRCYDYFQKEIEPFVLRREKEDVYTDIPKLNRIFTPIEITDDRLKAAYNKVLDSLESKVTLSGNYNYFQSIGELQILRQICGMAKVNWTADYAETFLLDSDRQKLAIGVHHHSVRDAMSYQLANLGVIKLDGEDTSQRKDYIAHKYFQTAPEQILLLGMMACNLGMALPYIDTTLIMEREWSSADEEQFEYRFYNPDIDYLKSIGIENKVTNIEYIIAKGTIDEFFYDLVEEKRAIFGETLSKNWDLTKDPTTFKQLIERTISHRL